MNYTYVLIGLIAAGAILYFLLKDVKTILEKPISDEDDDLDNPVVFSPSIDESTISTETESETAKKERLENVKSPDQDKPFAKISTPEISEIPVTSEIVESKPKPKKKYKPKPKPAASSTTEPIVEAKSVKKTYKRKTLPKKGE